MNRCTADLERRKRANEDDSISEVVGEFTRSVEFGVGYDHRAFPEDCGGGGHGQNGMELRFVLKGDGLATQWVVYTSLVPTLEIDFGEVKNGNRDWVLMGADLGYHSVAPMYAGHPDREACPYLDGAPCYYDGSGLASHDLLRPFLMDGPRAVWNTLESYYREIKERHAKEDARG